MDLRQLRYFLAVAETLNFTRASERSYVSQPALTKAIQRLEETLRASVGGKVRIDTKIAQLIDTKAGLAARALDGSDEEAALGRAVELAPEYEDDYEAENLDALLAAVDGETVEMPGGREQVLTTQNAPGANHSAINWHSFSVGTGPSVWVLQPGSSSSVSPRNLSSAFNRAAVGSAIASVRPIHQLIVLHSRQRP